MICRCVSYKPAMAVKQSQGVIYLFRLAILEFADASRSLRHSRCHLWLLCMYTFKMYLSKGRLTRRGGPCHPTLNDLCLRFGLGFACSTLQVFLLPATSKFIITCCICVCRSVRSTNDIVTNMPASRRAAPSTRSKKANSTTAAAKAAAPAKTAEQIAQEEHDALVTSASKLIHAVTYSPVAEVKRLLKEGAPTWYQEESMGWNCLHFAAERGDADIVKACLASGAVWNASEC